MNDKWSRDSFLLGSGSVDNHGGYLRCFFVGWLLPFCNNHWVGFFLGGGISHFININTQKKLGCQVDYKQIG
jgi:hypothetical protein